MCINTNILYVALIRQGGYRCYNSVSLMVTMFNVKSSQDFFLPLH